MTSKPIPIFDIRPQHEALLTTLRAAFERVIDRAAFILGDEVLAFEQSVCQFLGTEHAVGVSSGSDALFMALTALGIGPGHEVITTPLSFVATAEAIVRTGATPVFGDIDPEHLGLCPRSVERMVSARTRAVLYVHLFGNAGAIAEHAQACQRLGLHLVEDACQAFGARLGERSSGTFGTIGCFSFFPTKPLGGLGDGGLAVTGCPELSARLRRLRQHGLGANASAETLSGNFRLDALQAALLRVKLEQVERWRLGRAAIAARYSRALRSCPGVRIPPVAGNHESPAWSLYTLRLAKGRDALRQWLSRCGIESRVYYPSLLPDQPLFAPRSRCDELTQARRACSEVLSIPIFYGLGVDDQQRVIDSVCDWSRQSNHWQQNSSQPTQSP